MNKALAIATVLMAAVLNGIFSTSAYATEGGTSLKQVQNKR